MKCFILVVAASFSILVAASPARAKEPDLGEAAAIGAAVGAGVGLLMAIGFYMASKNNDYGDEGDYGNDELPDEDARIDAENFPAGDALARSEAEPLKPATPHGGWSLAVQPHTSDDGRKITGLEAGLVYRF